VFGALVWLASPSRAQAPAGAPAAGAQAPAVKVERGEGGKKVYRITTEFVIEGRIQKPNAFYVLQRQNINYDWANLKQDFLPRITESVNGRPF
jgi:hypothetical protein